MVNTISIHCSNSGDGYCMFAITSCRGVLTIVLEMQGWGMFGREGVDRISGEKLLWKGRILIIN